MDAQMNPVNPALANLLQLANMVTPEGTPTVAGQMAQAAEQQMMPPQMPQEMPQEMPALGVEDVAQQAGLAAQIQEMEQQQAQQQMMQMAQQASQQQGLAAGGLASLHSNIHGFKAGGIVGYSGEDDSVAVDPGSEGGSSYGEQIKKVAALLGLPLAAAADLIALPYSQYKNIRDPNAGYTPVSDVLRRVIGTPEARQESAAEEADKEAKRFAQDVPYVPGGSSSTKVPTEAVQERQGPPAAAPGAPRAPVRGADLGTSSAAGLAAMEREIKRLQEMKRSADPKDVMNAAIEQRNVAREFARATGNDPDVVDKMMTDYGKMYDEQLARIEARRAATEEGSRMGALSAFARNFRQMKGQPIGEGFRTGAEGMAAFDEATRARIERLEDLSLEIQRTRMEKVNALKAQKYNTDMGFFSAAQQSQQAAVDAARKEQMLNIELAKTQAELQSQEGRVRAQLESAALDRAANRAAGDQGQIEELYRLKLQQLAQGKPPTPDQQMQAREYALQTVRGAGSAARTQVAAGSLEIKRQELAEKNPMYRMAQFTAQNPKATESERAKANQTMREIEARAGIGATPVTEGGQGFRLVGVQPAPR